MLLIDGVKYEVWTPPSEDDFEQIVKEHAEDIFGESACYFDLKRKLKTGAGVGSIPDAYVVVFDQMPYWYIVEVELSSHPLYEHIVPQITKFVNGIQNPASQNQIVNAIDDEIANNPILAAWVKTRIQQVERHKFLSNLVTMSPTLVVIINRVTPELTEVCDIVSKSLQTKVVEFRTFTREGVGLAVHVHLFEPVAASTEKRRVEANKPNEVEKKKPAKASKVTFEELVRAGLVADGQTLYFYHTRPFNDDQAQIIASSDKLKYAGDGELYSTSLLAKKLLIKHGFKHDEYGVRGPIYWKTSDGEFLHEINERYRESIGCQ